MAETTYTVEHAGKVHADFTYAGLIAAGLPANVIGGVVKGCRLVQLAELAEGLRRRIDSASAGKFAEYRVKEAISGDPATASADELALLDREAAARGLDRAGLLALIADRAAAYRRIALMVAVLEAEGKQAIAAVPDAAADIEAQLASAFAAVQAEALTVLSDAQALIGA